MGTAVRSKSFNEVQLVEEVCLQALSTDLEVTELFMLVVDSFYRVALEVLSRRREPHYTRPLIQPTPSPPIEPPE